MKKIAFRMDDVGASTKQYEVYSKFPLGNLLFLKYIAPFKAWGPYRELTREDWEKILDLLERQNAQMTVGVTACWVDNKDNLTSFFNKFPSEAEILKIGLKKGLLEIANHGLTHCVVGNHLPKLFTSNRYFHREFWDFLPQDLHKVHLEKSQRILEDYFKTKIVTFIPPGSVYTNFTWAYAKKLGLKYLSAKNDKNVFAFHDRDIVLNGVKWLEGKIKLSKKQELEIVRVKDLS